MPHSAGAIFRVCWRCWRKTWSGRFPDQDCRLPARIAGTMESRISFKSWPRDTEILDFQPREFVADGDRVLVVGWERAKVKATNRTVELDWIMSFTVRNGKVAKFREYTDTKALADAYGAAARAAG